MGILEKLKYNYIFQLKSGLQFGTNEKEKQNYQSGTEGVLEILVGSFDGADVKLSIAQDEP